MACYRRQTIARQDRYRRRLEDKSAPLHLRTRAQATTRTPASRLLHSSAWDVSLLSGIQTSAIFSRLIGTKSSHGEKGSDTPVTNREKSGARRVAWPRCLVQLLSIRKTGTDSCDIACTKFDNAVIIQHDLAPIITADDPI